MEHHIIFGELRKSRWVVGCFLLKNGTLIVVEKEQIKKAHYSDELKYEDMTTVITSGYNNAASAYWEPLTGKDYLFILKDCGALELLDSQCNRLDLLDTGIRQDHNQIFFLFDDINQIYINLSRSMIFAVEYQVKNKRMSFVKRDEEINCIFEDINTIIGLQLKWGVDYVTGRDFPLISVLSMNETSKQYYLEVIRQLRTEGSYKRVPWDTFINHSYLVFDDINSPSAQAPILKMVSNVGLFIFASTQVLFIKLPDGYDQTVGKCKFETFQYFDGILLAYNLVGNDKLDLSTDIMLRRSVNSLEFWAFTLEDQLFKFTLRVAFEDPEAFIINWDGLSCEKLPVEGLIPNDGNTNPIQRSIFLSNTVAVLINDSVGATFVDLQKSKVINRMPYNLSRVLHSYTIGPHFHKHVSCSATKENEGVVESKFWGYSNVLSLNKSFTSEHKIANIWNSSEGVWWKNSFGQIFREGRLIETFLPPIHITTNGLILKKTSIAVWANIVNDFEGNYCYACNNGDIGWSDESEIVSVKNLQSSSLVKYLLSCSKLDDGSKITVLSVDNKITVLKNAEIVERDINLSECSDSLSSISIVPFHKTYRILICDIDGQLYELDLSNSRVRCKVEIGSQKADICAIPGCSSFLVYTRDDLMLMNLTEIGKYQLTRVDVKHHLSKIVARNMTDITVLDDDHTIYQYSMPATTLPPQVISKSILSKFHFHTKCVSLPCSNRYVITSSLHSEYSDLLRRKKYYSELQLHDLERQKTVFRYDLSKAYPQATVSDIVASSLHKSLSDDHATRSNLFAMQLAFAKVFIVSLNYEMAEDESLDNLLLFSLDDSNGSIDFLQGIETGHAISSLHTCRNRVFLAAGDFLRAYQIDYKVKENTFNVRPVSNEIYTGGLIKSIVELPNVHTSKMTQIKRRKYTNQDHDILLNDRIVVLNLLKGLQEYNLAWKSVTAERGLEITPVVNANRTFPLSSDSAEHLITFLSVCQTEATTWLAVGYSDKLFSLCCIPDNGEPNLLQMRLPGDITSICSAQQSNCSFDIGRDDSIINFERRRLLILFVVATSAGEYAIGKAEDDERLRKPKARCDKKMNEQLQFIQLEDEQSDFIFTDSRILHELREINSFEMALL